MERAAEARARKEEMDGEESSEAVGGAILVVMS